ncbi:MAG: iron chelate uptake ABC transporter family permease subunit [Prochlorotrichaceae cyanobacterium]
MAKVRVLQLLLLLTIATGLFWSSLAIGSVNIPLGQLLPILRGEPVDNPIWSDIVWQLRLPRSLTAIVAGAALAVGGLQMQTLFRNPLADPSILGINAGASLGVAIVVLSTNLESLRALRGFENTSILVAASVGSALTLSLMLLLSQRVANSIRLLIFGLMFGYITSAMVTILLQLSSLAETQTYLNWTFGSFAAISFGQWPLFAASIALGLTIAQGLASPLNLLALGEDTAKSLGAHIGQIRFGIILSTALLAGTVTAFCGPIAFLGVAVPHFCRQLFHSVDHRFLIPANALLGACLAIVADSIAQLPGQDAVLPLNSVTILIGAPAVIWIVLKNSTR